MAIFLLEDIVHILVCGFLEMLAMKMKLSHIGRIYLNHQSFPMWKELERTEMIKSLK